MSPDNRIIKINDPRGEEVFDATNWPAEDVLLVMSTPIEAAASVATWITLGKPEGFIDLENLIPKNLTHTLNFPQPKPLENKPIFITVDDEVFNQPFDEEYEPEEKYQAPKDFRSFLQKMLNELKSLDDLEPDKRTSGRGQMKFMFVESELNKLLGKPDLNEPTKENKSSPIKKVNEVDWKKLLDNLEEDEFDYPEDFDEDNDGGRDR